MIGPFLPLPTPVPLVRRMAASFLSSVSLQSKDLAPPETAWGQSQTRVERKQVWHPEPLFREKEDSSFCLEHTRHDRGPGAHHIVEDNGPASPRRDLGTLRNKWPPRRAVRRFFLSYAEGWGTVGGESYQSHSCTKTLYTVWTPSTASHEVR